MRPRQPFTGNACVAEKLPRFYLRRTTPPCYHLAPMNVVPELYACSRDTFRGHHALSRSPMCNRALSLCLLGISLMLIGCDMQGTEGRSTDLDEAIEAIVADYPEANVALSVRDPKTGTTFDRMGDHVFHAASTMKVPVMMEVFRQANEGRFSLDDSLTVRNEFTSIIDGSTYSIGVDSDDGIYARMGESMSIRDLVHNMITVSSNLATNLLIEFISPNAVQQTIERLGATGVQVLRGVEDLRAFEEGRNNVATASGLATLLESLMHHRAVAPEADSHMVAILLDQRFDSMIPRGLPAGTSFAHKTGWITAVHHDAGIVLIEDDEPYVLVVMTEGISSENESADLGAELAAVVHGVLRGHEHEP
jgi:beta-lactamase class A